MSSTFRSQREDETSIYGVIEKPSRFGHSAFKYVADRNLIVDPGYISDADYFSDLIYLPFRQILLFAADLVSGGFGLAREFDPAHYKGSSIDTTGSVVLPDGGSRMGKALRRRPSWRGA